MGTNGQLQKKYNKCCEKGHTESCRLVEASWGGGSWDASQEGVVDRAGSRIASYVRL